MLNTVICASFFIVGAILIGIKIKSRNDEEKRNKLTGTEQIAERCYKSLTKKYLGAYLLAVFGDWLQGPYVYQLYSEYGFKENQIALLFVTGFGSSFLFGTFTGPLADKYGRKRLTQFFCVSYSICCLIKLVNVYWILILGRVLAGISTSLLHRYLHSE